MIKAFSKQKDTKLITNLSKKFRDRDIVKDNFYFLKRMTMKEPSLSFKKLDNDYSSHLKLLKNIQKIKAKPSSGMILDTNSSIERGYKMTQLTNVIKYDK